MKNLPFLRRVGFALAGLRTAWHTESSFKFHGVAGLAVLGVLAWLKPAPMWWALGLLAIALVMTAELLNTAIEHLADHLHAAEHPSIKLVKDCAAGAVLIASLAALAVAAAFVYDVALR